MDDGVNSVNFTCQIDEAVAAIKRIIAELGSRPVTQAELATVKTELRADWESIYDTAERVGQSSSEFNAKQYSTIDIASDRNSRRGAACSRIYCRLTEGIFGYLQLKT